MFQKQVSLTRKYHKHKSDQRRALIAQSLEYRHTNEYNLTFCTLENFSCFLLSADFLSKSTCLRKILSGLSSECQTDWIQIRPDVSSGLIWVQSVCKGYEQTALVMIYIKQPFPSKMITRLEDTKRLIVKFWCFTPQSTLFQSCLLCWTNTKQRIVSCSKTQPNVSCESQTSDPLLLSLTRTSSLIAKILARTLKFLL